MVELDAKFEIDSSVVVVSPLDDVEKMLKDTLAGKLTTQISEKLEKMSFIDMELDEKTGNFVVEANLVLCSKQSILTSIEVMSTKMKNLDISEEDIVDILSSMTEESKGF